MGGFCGLLVEVAHTFASLLLIRTVTQPPQTAETGKCGPASCPRKKREMVLVSKSNLLHS